jgi:hypothetical protein
MGGLKAPGPDGLIVGFFQDHWHLIRQEVCSIVTNFFMIGRLDNVIILLILH